MDIFRPAIFYYFKMESHRMNNVKVFRTTKMCIFLLVLTVFKDAVTFIDCVESNGKIAISCVIRYLMTLSISKLHSVE